ncbi:uncharacterized protein FFB20_14744 [Fusarium fujikuroi]|uniref:Uncharacterized protein n=2 Tax=Fusarium fujikuroi TaxID=5127 RepID=S0DPU2_GIBF5|nr:uncharacterized protein FFUJ_04311 [Fusarium fujikuroi IMI 58289]KLO91989.1 uncharacterized protein Y057_1825 [Fusarium fujikuroi]QGI60789.1 hypothetical protein CEK27_004760 [Fusarium fujikuroi]QGI91691.1 hypothetical protein CEK26_004760 [Fusarium fujikuroi]CCT64465.1 uncharacterized protein FFUJ_04311 [Fusarium fujikuroi IMI 58289]SCN73697.1 uncharacterized protein FFE2_02916 [Fusarium fujikuroi]
MSYSERNSKKRKTEHNGREGGSTRPSTIFDPVEGGRPWTISVAIPSSILSDLASADQRMNQPARIARALAAFSVDEVVVFDDSPLATRPRQTDTNSYTGDTDPCHFLTHILTYLEAPPFMRKAFPLHPNLRLIAMLPRSSQRYAVGSAGGKDAADRYWNLAKECGIRPACRQLQHATCRQRRHRGGTPLGGKKTLDFNYPAYHQLRHAIYRLRRH